MEAELKILIPLFVLVLLNSCSNGTAGQNEITVGKWPITLSPIIQRDFDKYMKSERPTVFFVAIDGGSYSYSYCADIDGCLTSSATYRAMKNCQKYSNGVPCKIYAKGRKIVWE